MEYKLDEINLEFNWDGKERLDTYHGYVAEISLDGNNFVASTSGVLSNYSENALGKTLENNFTGAIQSTRERSMVSIERGRLFWRDQ